MHIKGPQILADTWPGKRVHEYSGTLDIYFCAFDSNHVPRVIPACTVLIVGRSQISMPSSYNNVVLYSQSVLGTGVKARVMGKVFAELRWRDTDEDLFEELVIESAK